MPAGNTYPFDPGSGTPTADPGLLPATRPTMPQIGTLPTGGTSREGMLSPESTGSGFDAKGLAGIAGPLIASLFMGNKNQDNANKDAAGVAGMANTLFNQGQKTTAQGEAGMAPVLSYLIKVAGGDPSALLNATEPERGRVLDQYDTAKKAMQFGPRGGGQPSATASLEASKASTITAQTAEARRSGVSTLGSLSADLEKLGSGESESGARALSAAGQLEQQNAAASRDSNAQWGKVIATVVPYLMGAVAW